MNSEGDAMDLGTCLCVYCLLAAVFFPVPADSLVCEQSLLPCCRCKIASVQGTFMSAVFSSDDC